jgi:hypothetical protein
MNRVAIIALLAGSTIVPVLGGCGQEVSKSQTVKTNPDGSQTTDTKTVTRNPDGSVTQQENKSNNNP